MLNPSMYSAIKKATKLKNADQITAWVGERTLVETTVAMEFAASWKPFMKSKTMARTIIAIRKPILCVFYDYGLYDLANMLCHVGGALHVLYYFLVLDDFLCVGFFLE